MSCNKVSENMDTVLPKISAPVANVMPNFAI